MLAVLAAGLVAVAVGCAGSGGAPAPEHGQPAASGRPAESRACGRDPEPGARTLTVRSGGLTRASRVHVPARVREGRPAPLLLVLHGAGGTGPEFEPYTRFSELADREGFVAVYPSAVDRFWTVGAGEGPDDVRFLGDLLDRLEVDLCIDPARVFVTGLSNGGGMSVRLACTLGDRIAAAAPVAGAYGNLPPCEPARPVSVLEMHGDADPIVPYEGDGPGSVTSAEGFARAWAERNGCGEEPLRRSAAPRAVRLDWPNCRDGSAVAHVRLLGFGHDIPGVTPRTSPPGTIFGPAEIWRFLSSHPRAAG